MTMKLLLAPLALVAGVAVALQAAANSGLKAQVGLGPALMINTAIVMDRALNRARGSVCSSKSDESISGC